MKTKLTFFLLFATFCTAIACTIGIAAPAATVNGRALLWKTRDIAAYPDNYLKWEDDYQYGFLYVRDQRDSLAWMGLNEKGFAIVNSYVERQVERPIFNNGSLMFHLLGNCAAINDMDSILDTLDITEQVLSGNFAVIDSSGNAALYEISWTEVEKYDVAESENGFLIRTNFSLISGGDDGIERFQRSTAIISELTENDQLDAVHLISEHIRDFSDDTGLPVNVPFNGRWLAERPWGYIKSNVSIARGIAASSVVIEGVLANEKAITTTMYSLLGHPAVSAFMPFWAIGEPPSQTTGDATSEITELANNLKALLFNYDLNSYYLDSYNLLHPGYTRLWDYLLPFETEMLAAVDEFLPQWRNGDLTVDNAQLFSEEWAYRTNALLDSSTAVVTNQVTADFEISNNYGGFPLTVLFQDRSLHNPTTFCWDFDNNGLTDQANVMNTQWTYEEPGIYSVRLMVGSDTSNDELIMENIVQVNQTPAIENEIASRPFLLGNYPNPFCIKDSRSGFTVICFYVPEPFAGIDLNIYNNKGQLIYKKEYVDTLMTGIHSLEWDGKDNRGKPVSNGVYYYKLSTASGFSDMGKMTVIK